MRTGGEGLAHSSQRAGASKNRAANRGWRTAPASKGRRARRTHRTAARTLSRVAASRAPAPTAGANQGARRASACQSCSEWLGPAAEPGPCDCRRAAPEPIARASAPKVHKSCVRLGAPKVHKSCVRLGAPNVGGTWSNEACPQ
eukprot:245686-Chlamydomonas_euryale.AAC.1